MNEQQKLYRVFILSLVLGQVFWTACTKDVADPQFEQEDNADSSSTVKQCDTLFSSFSQDVKPIFAQQCATSNCHSSSTQAFGIVLEDHSQIKSETKKGKALCTIRHESGCTNMPYQGSKISQKKIDAIDCWVKAGYPDN